MRRHGMVMQTAQNRTVTVRIRWDWTTGRAILRPTSREMKVDAQRSTGIVLLLWIHKGNYEKIIDALDCFEIDDTLTD